MSITSTHNVKALPRWAQDYIKKLETDSEALRTQLGHVTGRRSSPVYVEDLLGIAAGGVEAPMYLHPNRRIVFVVGRPPEERNQDPPLRIYAQLSDRGGVELSTSDGSIAVYPYVSNVVRVDVVAR